MVNFPYSYLNGAISLLFTNILKRYIGIFILYCVLKNLCSLKNFNMLHDGKSAQPDEELDSQ